MTVDALQVAVEIDLFDDRVGGISTLRLCNRGPLFSIAVPGENYEPCLLTPLQLGIAVSAQLYGQPLRTSENQGVIEFVLDVALMAKLFDDALHWVGRLVRVYMGQYSPAGFREDLDLVFVAVTTDITHDTKRASVRTGDSSTLLDVPLNTDVYPTTALDAIAGKLRPQAWGTVFSIEPVLIDDANLIFEISRRPIIAVIEARVGGVPWAWTSNPNPGFGQYHVNPGAATIRFGSDLLGGNVRLDVQATNATGIGDLATQVLSEHPLISIDDGAMGALDIAHPMTVGLYARDPINCLTTLDDLFGGVGALWGINQVTNKLMARFIQAPTSSPQISTPLDSRNVVAAALTQTIVPASRVKVEYERHWQTESQYFTAVDPAAKQRWSSPGLTVTREDSTILFVEPRAYDVPTVRSVAVLPADASRIADRFWNAWSVKRQVLTVSAEIDPGEIQLYATITIDYMMIKLNARVMSVMASIGGGVTELLLWG